jgi:uncharacterized protein (DUF1015 family)
MSVVKPFKGLRPPVAIARDMAARPYDVLNSSEAREEATGNPYSLLHITKPEIDLPKEIDEHAEEVYQKAADNFAMFRQKEWLQSDQEEYLYVYAQTMFGRTQYGIVGCSSVDDYLNNIIKKHELTRKDKEEDRMKHVRITNANMEPVFFTYRANKEIDEIVANVVSNNKADYDFTTSDEIGHHFWVIKDKEKIARLVALFEQVPALYVADGHHRTAAAALVGKEKREKNPNYSGNEEFNYFMAVVFPDNQLSIIDYNRVVKDLNGLSTDQFIEKLEKNFVVEKKGAEIYKPNALHNFGMYLEGNWYSLTAKSGSCFCVISCIHETTS